MAKRMKTEHWVYIGVFVLGYMVADQAASIPGVSTVQDVAKNLGANLKSSFATAG